MSKSLIISSIRFAVEQDRKSGGSPDSYPTGEPPVFRCFERSLNRESACAAPSLDLSSRGRFFGFLLQTGLDEPCEKRMRFVRFALEFGVILAGEEIRMV